MKKLVVYSFAFATALSLSACDSGDSSAAQAANGCANSSPCNGKLQNALNQPVNPGILTTPTTPAGSGSVSVSGGSTLTNTNTSTGTGSSTVYLNNAGFNANDILNQNKNINYEALGSAFDQAKASGDKSPAALINSYQAIQNGADGAR